MNQLHGAPPSVDHAKYAIIRFLVSLIVISAPELSSLHAQVVTNESPANTNVTVAAPSAPVTGQARGDMTKKITDLVNAGRYGEAQQLTTRLLVAYPDDQRLIRAKALIEKLLASGSSANPAPENSQPAQPGANSGVEELTGIDKVDYNALIELAREAQQSTDLTEQANLLKQFMEQSNSFLQKHPDQMLVWQLRAASAISLNEPMTGYEAGQRLLASGAADSNDANLERLLGRLGTKAGWINRRRKSFSEP